MPNVIYSRVEFKCVLHKNTHNLLLEMVTIQCFENFYITVVIENN